MKTNMSSMLNQWLAEAKADSPVWLDKVSRACADDDDCSCVIIEITAFNGEKRAYTRFFPSWSGADGERFVREYLCACVFNVLSAVGGSRLTIYHDPDNKPLSDLIDELNEIFQLRAPRRTGYGKPINEADRICAFLLLPPFQMEKRSVADYCPTEEQGKTAEGDLAEHLRKTAQSVNHGVHCGIDVGGTDIKLALAVDGELLCTREYDWNPSEFDCAELLVEPILRLTRLMRVCAAEYRHSGALSATLKVALDKATGDVELADLLEIEETKYSGSLNVLDSIGLSFPDVVLRDAIVGGETPKTQGMRNNPALEYDMEFAKITQLKTALEALCRAPGHVRVTNDGNMAAYTAAMELAHSERAESVGRGGLAHSLGTDLGTGWLDASGNIPEMTLELYDCIVDLGSWPSRELSPLDLRCVRNENSGLAGVRRYLGQAAVYRMAYAAQPALLDGFIERRGDMLAIRTEPEDMRKPCLELIMTEAERGNTAAEDIFRQVGRNLAHVTCDAATLLRPKTDTRFIFGRFVKRPRCFQLICEGFAEVEPRVTLTAADSDLAYTKLMRALGASETATVAQFGQAVGAIYFGMT